MDRGNSMTRPIKVMISIPNEGSTPVESYTNRLDNFLHFGRLEESGKHQKEGPRFEFGFVTFGRIFTPLAREEAAKTAIEWDMDYLLMIDNDMICPNDMFERLWKHDVDIVAPLAFTRNYPHKAVLYDIQTGWDPVAKTDYFLNHWVDKYPENQLVECDAVGFGAALIKIEVLKGMEEPRFMSANATGEDVLFCHKAGKAGYRVFMDTATKLGHLSHPVEVTEDYVKRVRKQMKFREPIETSSKYTRNGTNEAVLVLGD